VIDAVDVTPIQISTAQIRVKVMRVEMDRELPELNTVIRTFANEVEAHVAQAVLDANGIDSNLIRDDAGGMMPWLQWLHPIRLVVREADSIEAVELLDSPPGPG
jgi:hypothetical protein